MIPKTCVSASASSDVCTVPRIAMASRHAARMTQLASMSRRKPIQRAVASAAYSHCPLSDMAARSSAWKRACKGGEAVRGR